MDPTEDLSARVLLKHILTTEPPRTPITRGDAQGQSTNEVRRSKRLSMKDADVQTPKNILRRSLKHKIRESITRKSLPATKRRSASAVLRKTNTPAATSMMLNDGDTPRHLLMNILHTEPVKSPVVHGKEQTKKPELPPEDNTVTRTRSSIELSGLDLPDITIGNAASTAKGLSRKRPRRSLNVTAFEKHLKDGDDTEANTDNSAGDLSSLSLSSSTSLSLKTPFADVRTEKRGLQRRIPNRRKITEEEFGAAVIKRQMGDASSFAVAERDLGETAHSEGFTLGLSKMSEPDITADIVNCSTTLFDQPNAMTSNFSIVATQDKPTLMASQLQRKMLKMEKEQEENKLEANQSENLFPFEEEAESQKDDGVLKDAVEAELQPEEVHYQPEEGAAISKSEEEEDVAESQTGDMDVEIELGEVGALAEEEGARTPHSDEDVVTCEFGQMEVAIYSQTEEEEEGPAEPQSQQEASDSGSEDDDAGGSPSPGEDVPPDSQTEEEEGSAAECAGTLSQSAEEEEDAEVAVDSQAEDDTKGSQSEEDEVVAESQTGSETGNMEEEEQASEQLERHLEHTSRRAHRSEAGLTSVREVQEATPTARVDSKSTAHAEPNTGLKMTSLESSGPHDEIHDWAEPSECEPEAEKENSFPLLGLTQDIKESTQQDEASPGEAPAQVSDEQEEELEDEDEDGDEEDEEFSGKTPAFVKEKRNFLQADLPVSPFVCKNIQTSGTGEASPAAKPKQVRQRKKGQPRRASVLPKAYLMNVFRHFAKTKVSTDVYPVLNEIMDKFFDRLAADLEAYAVHGKRKTIEVEDAELLLKRQGHVNDKVPVEVLIEKYLRMDQRKLLIPIATSGNVVIPKRRR